MIKSNYWQIYNELSQISLEEVIQLIMESETQEQKDFFEAIMNYILQKNQKQAIERNLF